MSDQALWLLLAAGVAAVAVAVVVRRRRPGRTARPRPGEIWWADVPYADGTGSKVRPCLVLRRRWRGAVVLKITSQDKSRRRDHLPIPTRAWDRHAKRDSWVNLGEPVMVRWGAFERAAGTCDSALWRRVTAAPTHR
ncbi:type II toxin-antitoxin system PemK/MazF family toxin [Spirilliplanes yamanashiensis]|uniref:Type II toxin-antitoxin system PemK/MazF family toxin n=1 Tax=Spirilliplanes yamanashiensis TaxID=42233 RepID=A0A8J3Y4Q1_9ACTN|nr:type II toxin-antitoxin system PemK/MazF family toxin [Spirilliplanes yamanashiensis]MDP9819822.1 mRNA-degrading endonuclease toxin of MazEF toxin-antitoxin module [Spirilliplanes yamanashiensis]GIJ01359.1 hypothetical protein Sya03_07110 [Spirilliplanes yamanashiensis]